MLRCTAAGLMPIINSQRFAAVSDALFDEKRSAFDAIIEHNGYDLLTALPKDKARVLLLPVLDGIRSKQLKNGLWRGKNSSKTAFHILAAIAHAELMDKAVLRYSPLPALEVLHDEYSLRIKRLLGAAFTTDDNEALAQLRQSICTRQKTNGSFGNTVTGTVIHLERLLALGVREDNPVIRRGAAYLLSQRKPVLQGIHTNTPYDLSMPDVFTSDNRDAEFEAAQKYKPEWLPRKVCFRTMAVIPNAVCLNLLVRLGLEDDPGVSRALDSLYALYVKHGGLCATNIKKPYL